MFIIAKSVNTMVNAYKMILNLLRTSNSGNQSESYDLLITYILTHDFY